MSEEKSKKTSLLSRLQHTYRLVVMNNDTFEEVGSYRLSLLNVYVAVSFLMVIVALIVISLIIFTPLKRYIPGYADVESLPEMVAINEEIDDLSAQLAARDTYIDNLRKMLVGDVETAEEIPENVYTPGDSALIIDPIKEEEEIRQEVKLEEVAMRSRSGEFSEKSLDPAQLYFTAPLTGEISAGFMPEKKHYGVDILAPRNTPIKAALDGWVITSDWTLETGFTIGIQHNNNLITFYKHNSALLKKTGDFVKAGEALAIIGNTGTLTDGPHLHFELWYLGQPLDPTEYLNFN
ncbi:MAG: peptidoglycan DD-metalloendopeptidase family protein [Saprospiraceae bacterium]|nr:peptidoglycan DD-metalloendopeptidase family protein [Saprospiraceae bacterium]